MVIVLTAAVLALSTAMCFDCVPFNWKNVLAACNIKRTVQQESTVRFLSVGQGNCAVIMSGGKTALIDCAPAESAAAIASVLDELGITRIEYIFITHPHDDHAGGFCELSKRYEIGTVVIPPLSPDNSYTEYAVRRAIDRCNITETAPETGASYRFGGAQVTVQFYTPDADSENDCSAVYRAEVGEMSFLFTGDLSSGGERALMQSGADVNCDVLLASHHGSGESSCAEFILAAQPQCVICSCGINNTFGHPSQELINRLKSDGIPYFRTDTDGDITAFADRMQIASQYGGLSVSVNPPA